ncbi:alanine racemase [Chungangia koreensis]|uniref:Alanine racemase n=1 Tax=Chungangia koreensis TaxID=752657 RepID=A0ABV8X690_9LACT
MNIHYRPTYAEIDLEAIRSNIEGLKTYLDEKTGVIAVVKANAYGHGDIEVAKAAIEAGAIMLAVATPEEALRLREEFPETDILVMGPVSPAFAEVAAAERIMLTAFSVEWMNRVLEEADKFLVPLQVHAKVDSGMGRIGVRSIDDWEELIHLIRTSSHFILDGIYTHFATADEESKSFVDEQATVFKEFISQLPEKPRLVHAANSAAALRYRQLQFDAVRFGIAMYGFPPSPVVKEVLPYELKPALSLYSEIAHIKKVEVGSTIGYGQAYTAEQEEWIATLPIGYADGLQRGLSGQEVIIGGVRAPIVGRICMDQCMIRLSKEYSIGEQVVLIGKQGEEEIRMEEWAERLQTIPYETAVLLTNRVNRVYK